jgi:pentatricopeptide repeat protein
LEVKGVKDMQDLKSSLDALENEYGRNVQAFTYNRVMCSLVEHGMGIEAEEVLEDDSIVLTLRL